MQNSTDATSKTLLFPHQGTLRSIFQEQEINGLKRFWHILLEWSTMQARAYSVRLKNCAEQKCLP